MLLLFCSIIFVLSSAFFIANSFESKNIVNNIIYFFLCAFANVVFTFEILSLFSGISEINVIIVNFIFALLSFLIWTAKKCPIIEFDYKRAWNKFVNVLKLDKTIAIMFIVFLFACIVSLFLIAVIPGIDIDSTTYRVIRAMFWIDHGNLNQFLAPDARMLMFPINSEILYAWFMLFLKNDTFLFIFNFCGLGFFITVLYGFLSEITVSLRKKLWVILVASSIPFVVLRYTGLETGVIISALVLCSMYLYIRYLKDNKESLGFMSALALALGIGTKTTVILILPALLLWLIWYSFYCNKKAFYKPLIKFGIYLFVAFLLFASYNYFSNFLLYGNFLAAANVSRGHENIDGFFSTFPNLYRYIFDFFAFPEFIWSAKLSSKILTMREGLLNLLHANVGFGRTNAVFPIVSHSVSSASASLGFFGPLMFIPAYIYAIYKSFRVKNRNNFLLVSLIYLFLITVFLMSYKLAFMSYNIRFLSTFALLTIPVISCFYNKKYGFYKIIISIIAIFYLVMLPVNVSLYPVKGIINAFRQGATIDIIHNLTECTFYTDDLDINDYEVRDVACLLPSKIKKYNPKNKILFFPSVEDSLVPIKRLMFKGYNIDIALASEINRVNINDYNLIIICDNSQYSSTIFSLSKKLDEAGAIYEKGIWCSYSGFDNDLTKVLFVDRDKLDKVYCSFTTEFYIVNHLRFLNGIKYRVGNNEDGSIKYQTYRFYENLNNPIIK